MMILSTRIVTLPQWFIHSVCQIGQIIYGGCIVNFTALKQMVLTNVTYF